MKTFRVSLAVLLLTPVLPAQETAPPAAPGSIPVAVQRSAEELEQLLAPIALYPDALIALILPASTVPTDIVLAARHLEDNPGDRSQIEHRAWDESVKSLTNYPDVIKWMDENLHWTRQVGETFAVQPADVMQAIQRLRAKARAAGTLVDTPQQQVIAEPQVIRIVPAQPDIIYVPRYEPEVVFVDRPVFYTQPFLTFGLGFPVGSWLAYDCDWRHNVIWVGNRHRRWTGHDWRHPVVPFNTFAAHRHVPRPDVRQWRPSSHGSRITVTASNRFRSEVARPSTFGAPQTRARTLNHAHTGIPAPSFRDASPARTASPSDGRSRFSGTRDGRRDSGAHRQWGSSGRNRVVDTPPAGSPPARDFTPGFQRPNAGPRIASPTVVPAPPMPQPDQLATVRPAPSVRRPDVARPSGEGFRDFGNRSRSFRSSQSAVTPPLPVVPALPMATPQHNVQPMGPRVDHSVSRRSARPAAVTPLPMRDPASAPVGVGPVAPQSAPTVAPSSAPASRGGGARSHSGGHRGAGGRRSS